MCVCVFVRTNTLSTILLNFKSIQTFGQTNLSEFHVSEFILSDCHIPHTNDSAGSCSDDGGHIGTGGAQNLPPVT